MAISSSSSLQLLVGAVLHSGLPKHCLNKLFEAIKAVSPAWLGDSFPSLVLQARDPQFSSCRPDPAVFSPHPSTNRATLTTTVCKQTCSILFFARVGGEFRASTIALETITLHHDTRHSCTTTAIRNRSTDYCFNIPGTCSHPTKQTAGHTTHIQTCTFR